MRSMRIIGVIPAAGFAHRMGELAQSKETLTVGGRPVMDYIVERMKMAEPATIRLVTRADKTDVADRAEVLGLEILEAQPRSAAASITVAVADLADDDIVLIGFPDTIWQPVDLFCQLVDEIETGADIALGLFKSDHAARSDVVVLSPEGVVIDLIVKPTQPPSRLIWGCAAARRSSLVGLDAYDQPGEHFAAVCRRLVVDAVPSPGLFIDIGTPGSLEQARIAYGA